MATDDEKVETAHGALAALYSLVPAVGSALARLTDTQMERVLAVEADVPGTERFEYMRTFVRELRKHIKEVAP
jgi:hypothetical protein